MCDEKYNFWNFYDVGRHVKGGENAGADHAKTAKIGSEVPQFFALFLTLPDKSKQETS